MEVITARVPKYINKELKRRCELQGDNISNYIRTCILKELFTISSDDPK
jgi:hypothetical protein